MPVVTSNALRQQRLGCLTKTRVGLATEITKAASKQTYYTVRYLVDRQRVKDAYRAYAYFRWVDDWLDEENILPSARMSFIKRQTSLVECCYAGSYLPVVTPEEHLLVDLIANDTETGSGLQAYIRHMMAVMSFDARRRGRLIAQTELSEYSFHLAVAVTEALHHFIGHGQYAPQNPARYFAATAAHITHMLRDTWEDIEAGYFNIPCEVLKSNRIEVDDIHSPPYRKWVQSRVELARSYFHAGKDYLSHIRNWRCRIAGYAYIARFEVVLNTIELDQYRLRANYSECQKGISHLKVVYLALTRRIHNGSYKSTIPDSPKP
jgi:phytoene/squalene synthetase